MDQVLQLNRNECEPTCSYLQKAGSRFFRIGSCSVTQPETWQQPTCAKREYKRKMPCFWIFITKGIFSGSFCLLAATLTIYYWVNKIQVCLPLFNSSLRPERILQRTGGLYLQSFSLHANYKKSATSHHPVLLLLCFLFAALDKHLSSSVCLPPVCHRVPFFSPSHINIAFPLPSYIK